MSRAPMPPLEVQYPLCPVCGNEVEHDGEGFVCSTCHAYWDDRYVGSHNGAWDDPHATQCASMDGRWKPGGRWYESGKPHNLAERHEARCVLEDGHDGPHRSERCEWLSEDDAAFVAARLVSS